MKKVIFGMILGVLIGLLIGGVFWYGKYFEQRARHVTLQNICQKLLIYHQK